MTNPKSEGLHSVKRLVRIQDGTRVRFREDARLGIIDGLTEFVVGRNPDSRTQFRSNVEDPDRIVEIADDLLVLTNADGAV